MIFFCPRRYLPKVVRKHFALLMLTFSISATFASVYNPIVNAFALMCLVIPTFWLLFKELNRIKQKNNVDSQKVYELGVRTVVILTTAIVIWVNDRAFCSFYTQIRVTYLHAVWHVLIFL
jgi:alkaline ceramidase